MARPACRSCHLCAAAVVLLFLYCSTELPCIPTASSPRYARRVCIRQPPFANISSTAERNQAGGAPATIPANPLMRALARPRLSHVTTACKPLLLTNTFMHDHAATSVAPDHAALPGPPPGSLCTRLAWHAGPRRRLAMPQGRASEASSCRVEKPARAPAETWGRCGSLPSIGVQGLSGAPLPPWQPASQLPRRGAQPCVQQANGSCCRLHLPQPLHAANSGSQLLLLHLPGGAQQQHGAGPTKRVKASQRSTHQVDPNARHSLRRRHALLVKC